VARDVGFNFFMLCLALIMLAFAFVFLLQKALALNAYMKVTTDITIGPSGPIGPEVGRPGAPTGPKI